MTALITGSLAYDTIMLFPGKFSDHILPEQTHSLSVAFMVSDLRREFGGCAGNIAYGLKRLGEEGVPMATVGHDFEPEYSQWLTHCGIRKDYIKALDNTYTAQAYITTDETDNQITAFHPGAMSRSHENDVRFGKDIRIGVVAPDGREGMLAHAREFAKARIPFLFDPGQGLPMFNAEELMQFLDWATWVAMNDYESAMFSKRTGLSFEQIAVRTQALIITRGEKGSSIYVDKKRIDIPPVKPRQVVDPTGCGDAYRAGLIHGLLNDFDWETSGRIASLMGAIKVASLGTQNYEFTLDEFQEHFREAFEYSFA